MSLKPFVIAVLLLAALAGCATQRSGALYDGVWPSEMAAERARVLAPMKIWTLKGRLGVQLKNDGFSAGMVWLQDHDNFDISLFDPVGRRVAWLRGNNRNVDLQTAQGQSFTGSDPERLLQEHLGWSIPVRSLSWWVKGLPDPATVAWSQEYDDYGRLIALNQGGWSMRIARYQDSDKHALPRLTRMEHKDVKLKLLIKSWE
jgi:outer membrane lipoprotein LolB